MLACCPLIRVDSRVVAQDIEPATQKELLHISKMGLEELAKELDETWTQYARQLEAVVKARLIEEREFVDTFLP